MPIVRLKKAGPGVLGYQNIDVLFVSPGTHGKAPKKFHDTTRYWCRCECQDGDKVMLWLGEEDLFGADEYAPM